MTSHEMKIREVRDKGGAILRLKEIDGRFYYPGFRKSVVRNLPSLKIREDDVLLAGYPKTGTHWIWEILRMLLAGTVKVPSVEKDTAMIEQIHQVNIHDLLSPRVLNSHILFEQLPTDLVKVKPKIVYTTRNPKDVALSLYNHHIGLQKYHYNGKLDDYLTLFCQGNVDYGSFFEHIQNWSRAVESHPDLEVHVVNYEDMCENGPEQIQELAQFLGVAASPELIQDIHVTCTIDAMRKRKGQFDLDDDGNPIMYKKGGVGNWKTRFTGEMNKEFDQWYEQKMKNVKTNFYWRFSLD